MRKKNIIAGFLLLFVVASVVYLVAKEFPRLVDVTGESSKTSIPQVASSSFESNSPADTKDVPHKVLVYYFHGNFRCPTCRKFEAYAREAVTSAFSDELKTGKLQWVVANVDEPPNEHFIRDYELTTRSLVLVEMRSGKQTKWKNLEGIWGLVGNKEEFLSYVQAETRAYLEAE